MKKSRFRTQKPVTWLCFKSLLRLQLPQQVTHLGKDEDVDIATARRNCAPFGCRLNHKRRMNQID